MCCFNPRTREGCDLIQANIAGYQGVSIHAPAKGATAVDKAVDKAVDVSIHAPAKGATYD